MRGTSDTEAVATGVACPDDFIKPAWLWQSKWDMQHSCCQEAFFWLLCLIYPVSQHALLYWCSTKASWHAD